ncbi:MAG: polysaccharide biosynthesis protein [Clostridia bacterium]
MERKSKSFVQGAAILAVAGLIVKIIGALFRIPLANDVGSIGMSYYEVAYPYYAWLLVISSAGLPTAISKMVSERVTLGDYRGANKVFRTALILLCGIGVVTSLLMFFGADALASISTFDKASLSFKALAPALLFVSIMCAFRGYLQGMQLMMGTAISQIVEQVGKLAIGYTLAIKMLPMGPEYAAMGALIGVTISEVLALIVIILFYASQKRRSFGRQRAAVELQRDSGPVLKAIILMAVPITIGASISPLTGIVDSALIGSTLLNLGFTQENAQIAYSLLRTNVTTLVNMPGVLTMALAMSLVPAISASITRKDYSGAKTVSRLGLKLALVIGLPCAAGMFVLASQILSLLYPNLSITELQLATELLRTASIGVIFLSLVQSMTGVIQGMGRPNVPVFNLFIGFVLKVITMLVLMNIPSINIQGAAVSTVVCYAFAGIADTIYTIRKSGMQIKIFDVFLKPLLSALVMGGAVKLCYDMFARDGHSNSATLISIIVGMAIYITLVLVLKMFSDDELGLIPGGKKIKKLLGRK